MSFSEIILKRASRILDDFRDLASPPLMAVSPKLSLITLGRSMNGEFKKSSNDSVLRFFHNQCPESSFTMVLPDFRDYRDEYLEFINSQYATNFATQDIPRKYDVDHMLAASNSPTQVWVRLEAVCYSSNRSHGGGIEKSNANSDITIARKSNQHRPGSMTWLVAAKLAMIKSPLSRKAQSASAREKELIGYFVKQGFNRMLVEKGLSLCQHDLTSWLQTKT